MRTFFRALGVALLAAGLGPAEAAYLFQGPAVETKEHVAGFLWVETEHFAEPGAWRLDTQFTHKMGSAYLIAPGVGKPVGAAKTTVRVATAGTYRAWARTKDWLPELSPGKFRLDVGGRSGRVLGASGRDGWHWEAAGDFALAAGPAELRLVDLSGAFARCDAVLLTRDLAYAPPDDAAALATERLRLKGQTATVAEGGAYDVLVVGAGTAGCGAALAAARTGARTALVHDRPILGGNSSRELGIGTNGAAGAHPNHNLFARETGLCEEMNLSKKYTTTRSASETYELMASLETNLTVRGNARVIGVETGEDGTIAAVVAQDTLTGARTRYRAAIFIDATGDGWVGRFAGAELMHGREAAAEFGEAQAPETRDDLMMSGCLMDGYVAYRWRATDRAVAYAPPVWAKKLPEGFTRYIKGMQPSWWIEHHGRFDELKDPEGARDELIRIVFAYWGWLKNVWKGPGSETAELVAVPHMNGRREGYRLVGDHVLTANDCLEGRVFPDRVAYGGWPLDTHDPLGMENPTGNGYWKHHPGVPIYTIPYRCLYSKNVPNLMMAGRDVSVTHIALGSVRVEATCFTMGQAAGTAAALAVRAGLTPRAYGERHIGELQQRLLKDDQYIPGVKNEDPRDLARAATRVTATSLATTALYDATDRNLLEPGHAGHRLDYDRAVGFNRRNLTELKAVKLHLGNRGSEAAEVPVRLYASRAAGTGPRADHLIAETTVVVKPGKPRFVTARFKAPVALAKDYLWVSLRRTKDVTWTRRVTALGEDNRRAYGNARRWKLVPGESYAFLTEPVLAARVDTKPDYVIDGVARPVGDCSHAWISDPDRALPQALTLSFAAAVTADCARLTFDTNLTPDFPAAYPRVLVKAYAVEGLVDGSWRALADVDDNGLRLRVHRFAPVALTALRVTVRETWGDRSARIQEVRLYREGLAASSGRADPRVDPPRAVAPCEAAEVEKLIAATPDGGVARLPARAVFLRRPIVVKDRKRLTIRGGKGTVLTLHFTPSGPVKECTGGFVLDGCEGLTIENLRVTTDVPVNASGRVVATNPKAGTYDVRIDPAFPVTGAEHLFGLDTCDEEGTPDYTIETYNDKGNPIRYEVIGPQLLRVRGPSAAKVAALKPRQRVVYRYIIYGSTVFSVRGCAQTALRDIEIERCASFGLCVMPASRDLTLERFNMRPPKGDPALFAANADGVHILGLAGKLTMRDCHFRGLGDDALNIHGKSGEVKAYDPATGAFTFICRNTSRAETRLPRGWAEAGSRIVVYDGKTNLEKGLVTLKAYDPATGRGSLAANGVGLNIGDCLANDRDFAEVEVTGCSVENTRARAFVLQSRKLRVADCRFSGLSLPALLIATDFTFWNECGPTRDCEIRNCAFDKCALIDTPVNRGAIVVKVGHDSGFGNFPPGVHRNVRVVGNRFTRCARGAACFVATDGVTATGNWCARGDRDFSTVNCANVRIGGNFSEAAVSPDGLNRIDYRDGLITVSRAGRVLLGPQPVGLELDRGAAKVELLARDDGVAYRFVTDEDGEITVSNETCALVFPQAGTDLWVGYNWCDNPNDPKQDKLQHGCASVYTKTTPGAFAADGRRLAYLPLTMRAPDGTTVLFSESDVRDYAGLHIRRDGRETNRLDGVWGKFPVREREWTAPRNYRRVREREDWIVKTKGRRTFPWRVFAIAARPIDLAEQRLVRDLAAPPQGDFSWVEPGLATWEWWNKWHLENVPFAPGVNTATYKAYIDFAAEYALKWLLVDEGWKEGDDFTRIVPAFDLDAIVAHAAARGVNVMLWTAWRALDGRQDEVFAAFAKRGVKGFKIDFMERDDAEMMRFMETTLQAAARHRLCIDYHGSCKPTGLEKTYPNLIGMEGVHGLELMKLGVAKNDDFPAHDCLVAYTRAPLGLVDYTPGAMQNLTRAAWRPNDANPASQGTRVHQMALYALFPVPFQTLCDSPSRYRANEDCTRFLAAMPTTWDETRGLAGEIGESAAVARRKGDDWWIGAITDWSPRALTIDTTFLGEGRWTVDAFADAADAASRPEHWTRTTRVIRAGEPLALNLAPGGGWAARVTPVLSNRVLNVTREGATYRAFRNGANTPFAIWSGESTDAVVRVRVEADRPFVYLDVAPRPGATNRVAGCIRLPSLTTAPFATKPVRQGAAGLGAVDGLPSCGYVAIAEPFARRGVVAGWLTNFKASGAFETRMASGGRVTITPLADYGPMRVEPRTANHEPRATNADTLVIGAFDDCRLGLEAYADAVAARHAIRLKPNRTGYCTWCSDRYGASDRSLFAGGCGAGTEASTREFAAEAVRKLVPYGFEFIQFDDQWQSGKPANGPAKDWSRPNPKGPYPNGFKAVVGDLNRQGLAAGLWFVPFGGDAASSAWTGCEDLYVKSAVTIPRKIGRNAYAEPVALPRKVGEPVKTVWGGECLDLTRPETRQRLAETVRRFTRDWGFRYLKCDGIFTGFGCDLYGGYDWRDVHFAAARFADERASNVSAYRRGFETIRAAATPDTFILGCNLGTIRAMVPSFGLVDGMRIGNDNGPIGQRPMQYLEGPRAGSMRYFFNGRVWRADPDSTYVRTAVPLGRARMGATWTALSDSLFEVGDWLPDLPEERVEILRRTMAHHGSLNLRPIDYFETPLPNAWILDGGANKVLAFFNWSTNETLQVDYDFAYAGLDAAKTYVGFDFWEKRFVAPFAKRIQRTVPPDSCCVLAIAEARADEPVFVSSSAHVAASVGRVAVTRRASDGLAGTVDAFAGDEAELRFVVPPASTGWVGIVEGVEAPFAREGETLRLAYRSPTARRLVWQVRRWSDRALSVPLPSHRPSQRR